MVMYLFQCFSFNPLHPLHPPLCPQVHSLCLHLYSCPANTFISNIFLYSIVPVQSLSCVQLCNHMDCGNARLPCPWAISSIFWSLLKLMSIESVMPSNHLILYCPLVLLPSIFPSIRIFSSESALRMRWPKYWSFSFSISPSNEYSGLISFMID